MIDYLYIFIPCNFIFNGNHVLCAIPVKSTLTKNVSHNSIPCSPKLKMILNIIYHEVNSKTLGQNLSYSTICYCFPISITFIVQISLISKQISASTCSIFKFHAK
ncbi:hypothetical protein AAZV13_08G242700 [Glycine max]